MLSVAAAATPPAGSSTQLSCLMTTPPNGWLDYLHLAPRGISPYESRFGTTCRQFRHSLNRYDETHNELTLPNDSPTDLHQKNHPGPHANASTSESPLQKHNAQNESASPTHHSLGQPIQATSNPPPLSPTMTSPKYNVSTNTTTAASCAHTTSPSSIQQPPNSLNTPPRAAPPTQANPGPSQCWKPPSSAVPIRLHANRLLPGHSSPRPSRR
jgi:hypothetical protein